MQTLLTFESDRDLALLTEALTMVAEDCEALGLFDIGGKVEVLMGGKGLDVTLRYRHSVAAIEDCLAERVFDPPIDWTPEEADLDDLTENPWDMAEERESTGPSRSPPADPFPKAGPAPEGLAERTPAEIGEGGGAGVTAAITAPATEPARPVPGSASALAAADLARRQARAPVPAPDCEAAPAPDATGTNSGTTWTEAEDARLIALVVGGLRQGLGKGAATRAAAEALGRPVPGTEFRLKRPLRDRLEAALAAPAPVPDLVPAPLPDAASAAQAADDPMAAHLDSLPDAVWSLAMDRDLLEAALRGENTDWIAEEFAVTPKQIAARFDVLTGQYRDPDTGKLVRRFARDAVLAAIEARLAAGGGA